MYFFGYRIAAASDTARDLLTVSLAVLPQFHKRIFCP
jgi:hypothetical protein